MSSSSNLPVGNPPAGVLRAREVMAGYPHPWALCGGWAVDLWLGGGQTREHVDLDITIFERDLPAVFEHFAAWSVRADDATNGANREQWDGRALVLPAHLHANDSDGFEVELIVNPGSGGDWVLSSEPSLVYPFEQVVRQHPAGLAVAAPEVLMFYKSRVCRGCAGCSAPRKLRPHDEADFDALLPTLPAEARTWLRGAMDAAEPGHPWLAKLA